MDRAQQPEDQREPSMQAGRRNPIEHLLSIERRVRRESEADAIDRRAVHEDPVLWIAENDSVVEKTWRGGESETHQTTDASDGVGSGVSETAAERACSRTPDLSVFIARSGDLPGEPGVERGHHLHSTEARLCVPGSDHGLVQQIRAELGSVDHLAD